jgi:hypothetical protein
MNPEDKDELRKMLQNELQDVERERGLKRSQRELEIMQRNTRIFAGVAIVAMLFIYTLILSECSARRVFREYEQLLRPTQTK